MTSKQKILLVLSIAASIAVWGFLYGWLVGTLFTFAILFHEYGHYYWMGREGIRSRTMAMMPPFGAIAMAKELWPSCGSESRIALAGPGFGLVSALVLLLAGLVTENYDIKIAVFAVCLVNLFNFWTPVAVLDGGRVVKPILLSLNTKLGMGFYYFSFFTLLALIWNFPSLFTIVVCFLILNILGNDIGITKHLVAHNRMVRMSGQEIVAAISWFLLISIGFLTVISANGIGYGDFINFITDR